MCSGKALKLYRDEFAVPEAAVWVGPLFGSSWLTKRDWAFITVSNLALSGARRVGLISRRIGLVHFRTYREIAFGPEKKIGKFCNSKGPGDHYRNS
jgi:hypothetical protein